MVGAVTTIVAAGRAAGVFSAEPAAAAAYRRIGANFLLVGVDTLLLRNAAVALAAKFRDDDTSKTGASY